MRFTLRSAFIVVAFCATLTVGLAAIGAQFGVMAALLTYVGLELACRLPACSARLGALGTLSSALVTLRVMEFLRKQFPMLGRIATDFSEEQVDFNQQVIAHVVTPPAVDTYDPDNGGYNSSATTVVPVPVTINVHPHVTVEFNINELSSTKRNLIDEQAKPAAYSLGKDAIDRLVALITPANFPTETVEAVNNVQRSTLGKLRMDLNGQGASPFARFAMLNDEAFNELTDDNAIISSEFNPRNAEDNKVYGELTGLKGFESVFEYTDLPSTSNLIGFAGNRSALVLASRIPKDPALIMPEIAGGGKVEVVRDPDSGLAMLVRTWYDWKAGKVYFSLVWMIGVAKGVAGHGRRLVHTANT